MTRPVYLLATAVCGLALPLSGVPSAQADAIDTAGPRIVVAAAPSFLVGQNFTDPVDLDGDLLFFNGGGSLEYRWTASDPSDICRYSVDEENGVEGWSEGVLDYETNATSGQVGFSADGYESSDDLSRVRINAYDCAGNVSSVERRGSVPRLVVDYGPAVPAGWSRTSCDCAMGDSTLRTRTKGASLSTQLNAHGNAQDVALIMAKGPGRGKAAIYYDGVLAKTVDTYAKANSNRVVMWQIQVTGSADHTVKVVNLATPGRTRIDVDAFIGG